MRNRGRGRWDEKGVVVVRLTLGDWEKFLLGNYGGYADMCLHVGFVSGHEAGVRLQRADVLELRVSGVDVLCYFGGLGVDTRVS